MRRHRAILAIVCLLAPVVLARYAAAQTSRAEAPASVPTLRLWVRNGWLKFHVADGQIIADSGVRQQKSALPLGNAAGAEQLQMKTINGQTTLKYSRKTSKETLELDFVPGDAYSARHSSIRRKGTDDDSTIVPMALEQDAGGATTLTLGTLTLGTLTLGQGEAEQTFCSTGLWHLLITQPEPCREHLLPVLELLHPDWQLGEMATTIEHELLRLVDNGALPNYRRLGELVEQLNDDRFAVRSAADRELREAGQMARSYLAGLDFGELQAEQQFRIRRIIRHLEQQSTADTPKTLGIMLVSDPTIWLALLSRPEEATRVKAAKQLAGLLDSPIDIDPAADPSTQAPALEALRKRIASPAPDDVD